jgi:hypothetical protein
MKRLILSALMLAVLPGCTTTLYGTQTISGGSSATTTGSYVRGSTQAGNVRLRGSFGSPPPAGP